MAEARCLPSLADARRACAELAERFGEGEGGGGARRGGGGGEVRRLTAALKMGEGMPDEAYIGPRPDAPLNDAPVISERDQLKLERRRRKEDRQRQIEYEAHLAEVAAVTARLPPIMVSHGGDGLAGTAKDIHMESISIAVAGKELVSDATVTLAFGRRYGLVGRNGTGKTTFLRHMAMHELSGIPRSCNILHVEQEVAGDNTTVLQCVLNSDVERTALLDEEKELSSASKKTAGALATTTGKEANGTAPAPTDKAAQRLAEIYKRLEVIDSYSAEARAASILAGLSFTSDMQLKATKTFSGGWRMRVALARALFVEPDLLLLDEPTNHLDLHAVLWLEDYLVRWPKTLIVVSHAREFLNAVATDILYLRDQKITTYKGDYDTFEKTRNERLRNQAKAKEANERTRAHMQAFIDKFRYNAKRASLVQSRIKALERVGVVDDIVNDPDYKFEFPTPEDRPMPPIVSFIDASFAYPGGQELFRNLNFGIDLDSRLAMVGPNGIGKSTLLKLISGELQPTSGTVFRSAKVRMAVFSQHHVDGLDLSMSPLLDMSVSFPGVPEQKLRSHLGSFGVGGNLALQPMFTLSGGQKSRVAFAKITFKKPHILLLDEPSNHLDLDAVEALIQGLAMYQGGVLVVSHDEHLITGSVDELWVISAGKATPFNGSFKEYRQTLRAS
eukprot:SM000006S19343  [mRNA]  locus=s6:192048:197015:+ [translate_table: standard]